MADTVHWIEEEMNRKIGKILVICKKAKISKIYKVSLISIIIFTNNRMKS